MMILWPFAAVFSQSPKPVIRLDSIALLDDFGHLKMVPPARVLNLQARENYLTFRFVANGHLPIQYRLDGLDNEWLQGYSSDQIHYANLPGGNYTLQVRYPAARQPEQIHIRIEAPFWRRWWFIPALLLYLLSVVGVVGYLFLQYRFRQKLRAIEARDRIARDLHDDMGSYLSSISIMSQTAHRNVFRNPEKAQSALDSIGQTARKIIDRMGDMVWSINPSHDSMEDVIARMADVGNNLFNDPDVVFNLSVADDIRRMNLSAEMRREFFLIYKEALTNVVRYANANGVRVTVRHERVGLVLTVQDNGCGFDTSNPTYKNAGGGNGLGNMQARAKLIDGQLTIQSVPGEGTTVRLVVAGGGNG